MMCLVGKVNVSVLKIPGGLLISEPISFLKLGKILQELVNGIIGGFREQKIKDLLFTLKFKRIC